MGEVPLKGCGMTSFLNFCRLHGVSVHTLPPEGRWVRVATEDKPRHRNGSVKFMGDHGFVQNWATMTEPAVWKAEGLSKAVIQQARASACRAAQEADQQAAKAAAKAAHILQECELAAHPYLGAKGFAELQALVWNASTDNLLIVPMRNGRTLVGLQQIKADGDKKFLFGQRSGGAEYVMGNAGVDVLCEGYATGLSVQAVMRQLKAACRVHVTFSAGNMVKVARSLRTGLVVADNDASQTGERAAQDIGWPYWLSDRVDEDFNDAHQRLGAFALAMQLKGLLMRRRP